MLDFLPLTPFSLSGMGDPDESEEGGNRSFARLLPKIPLWLLGLVSLTFLTIVCVQIYRGASVDAWGFKLNENGASHDQGATPTPRGKVIIGGQMANTLAGELYIPFPKDTFRKAPVVVVTPCSPAEAATAMFMPTVVGVISAEGFWVRNYHVGPKEYVNWIAIEAD